MARNIISISVVLGIFLLNFSISFYAISQGYNYGLVTFFSVLLYVVIFITLERIIPYKQEWHPTLFEWGRDGIYLLLVFLAGAIGQSLIYAIAFRLATPIGTIPFWSEIIAALLYSTFGGYWFHRLGHEVPLLWKIHGIHHVPVKVNLANNSVVHSFDVIGSAIFSQLPLLILGFSEESMFISGMITMMLGYFIHANIDIRVGWLNYIINTPQSHRLHHSIDIKEAGHFGTDLAIWDLVFKSFTWHVNRVPVAVGMEDDLAFPRSESIFSNLIHPFRMKYRRPITK